MTLDEKLVIRLKFQSWLSERSPLGIHGQDLEVRTGLADRFLDGAIIMIKKDETNTEFWTEP